MAIDRRRRSDELEHAGDRARAVVESLFAHPPASERDIPDRLRSVDPNLTRRLLIDRLEQQRVTDQDVDTFIAVFSHLGLGAERKRVARLVLDGRRSHRVRAYACGLLASEDPAYAEELMTHLPSDDRLAIMDVPFVDMLVWAQADAAVAEQLALAMEGLSEELQGPTFERIEQHRRDVGTAAIAAYGAALRRGRCASLVPLMLQAMVGEPTPDAMQLVQDLRDAEREPTMRRELQGALLRMATRSIDPDRAGVPSGYAFLSSCDNQGDFVLVACFENPDRSLSVVDLCVRRCMEIRGGFVMLRQTEGDLTELLAGFERVGGSLVRIPLPQASAIIDKAVERSRDQRKSVPRQALPAVALLQRVPPDLSAVHDPVPPAWDAPIERVRTLLARPEYDRTWYFTARDLDLLADLGCPNANDESGWLREAARRLSTPSRRRRLVDMAKHMALWHKLNGEPEEASLCATLAQLTDKRFSRSPLVVALLERTARPGTGEQDPEIGTFGNSALRGLLRAAFFAECPSPRGRDLALLDLTEAAYVSLDHELDGMSNPLRLDRPTLMALAFALAQTFITCTITRKKPREPRRVARRIRDELMARCALDGPLADRVASCVLSALEAFVRDVCARCPIRCIDHLRLSHRETFFASRHPAADDAPSP